MASENASRLCAPCIGIPLIRNEGVPDIWRLSATAVSASTIWYDVECPCLGELRVSRVIRWPASDEIRAEWTYDAPGISVHVTGFLAPGRGSSLEISALLDDEPVSTRSRSLPDLLLQVTRKALEGVPIKLRHERGGEDGWELTTYLSF